MGADILPNHRQHRQQQELELTMTKDDITAQHEEVELESPNFEPQQLREFRERGFERRNRWTVGPETERTV